MPKVRRNIYFPEQQWARLVARSQAENLPVAEIVRRAVDVYLAWDDPTYRPGARAPNKQWRSHPPHE